MSSSEFKQRRLMHLGTIFASVCILLTLVAIGFATIAIGWFSSQPPQGTEIDEAEFARAHSVVQRAQQRLELIEAESKLLDQRIAGQKREWALRAKRDWELLNRHQGVDSDVSLNTFPSTMPGPVKPTKASIAYGRLFHQSRPDSRRLSVFSTLSRENRRALGALVIDGFRIGHADAWLAAMTIQRVNDPALSQQFLRDFLRRDDPLPVAPRSIAPEDVALALVDSCSALPAEERAGAVNKLALLFLQGPDEIDEKFASVIDDLEGVQGELAALVCHPRAIIRESATTKVPIELAYEAALDAIKGDEYILFVGAIRWLAEQPVQERVRKDVLDALAPFLGVKDGEKYLVLDCFVRWADPSVGSVAQQWCIRPVKDVEFVSKFNIALLETGTPLQAIVGQATGPFFDDWFRRFLEGNTAVQNAVEQVLLQEPPPELAHAWVKRLCDEGGSDELAWLEPIVAELAGRGAKTVYYSSIEQQIQRLRLKFQKPDEP